MLGIAVVGLIVGVVAAFFDWAGDTAAGVAVLLVGVVALGAFDLSKRQHVSRRR